MEVTFDLMDLLLALLVLVGITLGIFIIIFIARLSQTMKNISRLTADIHDPITKTTDQLPDLIKKVDGIAEDVNSITGSANETIPGMLGDAKTITGTARAGVEAVGNAASTVSSGVSSLFGTAKESAESVSSIIDVVGQVLGFVSIFTGRKKSSKSKKGAFGRKKKSR